MKRYVRIWIGLGLLSLVAGWSAFSVNVHANSSTDTQRDDLFGEVYPPFAQSSPEELSRAVQSMPPPKPAPILSVEKAQRYVPFKLALMRWPSAAALKGVTLTREIFPDGETGQILAHVVYDFQGKEITLNEMPTSPGEQVPKPKGGQDVAIAGATAGLLENWVPG